MSEYTRALEDFEAARMNYNGPDQYHRIIVHGVDGKQLPVDGVWRNGRTITIQLLETKKGETK